MTTVPTMSIATTSTRSPRQGVVRAILRSPLGIIGLVWLLILIVVCALAPALPLADPIKQDLSQVLQLPSAEHWLGTDSLGRDVLSRLIFGGQTALAGAALATVIALVLGSLIGLVAGWFGGLIDATASRIAELIFSMPAIVLLLAVAAIFGRDITVAMLVFGVLSSAAYLRLAQATTHAVRNELFVDAAKLSGMPSGRIMFREVLPNIAGPLVVQSSLTFGVALLVMASLGFLGLGPTPPAPDWGAMIAEASKEIFRFPWLLIPTGLVLSFTILAANLLGDAIRDGDGSSRRPNWLQRGRTRAGSGETPTLTGAGYIASDAPVLRVEGLEISFPVPGGDTRVVCGVDFEVGRGEILGLVGESGSGKTMTALAVLGLTPAPGRISGGRIEFAGVDLASAPEPLLREVRGRRIALISQEPMVALDPSFTIRSQLIPAIRRFHGIPRKAAVARARSLLLDVGLRDPDRVLNSFPFQLSGGMAQRVAIALALAGDPEVLIADEPTTALDVTVQAGILDLLRDIRDTRGMGILLVTHDLGVVAEMCDRVVVMEHGLIVEQADVDDLFEAPTHPYTKKLIASTPNLLRGDVA